MNLQSHISNKRLRSAFTITELLICLSVIGLLLSLVLISVQSARETARRLRCAANLRQIGIAMNSYCYIHNMFPPSQITNGKNWSSNYMSELCFLLPQIEERALFDSINMCFSNLESPDYPILENRTARNTPVELFLCPSDPRSDGLNSYRFNRGRFDVSGSGLPYDGPFSIGVLPSQVSVSDGLTNTAFVSERVIGTFGNGIGEGFRDIKYPTIITGLAFSSDKQFIPFCLDSRPESWLRVSGRYWLYSGFAYTHYNHNGLPNDRRPSCGWGLIKDAGIGLHPPRSYHARGVNVLFGDGHVSFVTGTVSEAIWIALGTYDSGDIVTGDD